MPSTTISDAKALLRKEIRARMKALFPEERRKSDDALFARFLALPAVAEAGVILLYHGMGAELDTARLIPALLDMGKTVALPRCTDEPGIMDARPVEKDTVLIRHRYGMLEPGPDRPVIPPEAIDLILVPGLAFDRQCYRLGQGGGYYDRYLERFSGAAVALCRDCFLLDAVPHEEHDHRVDQVITETGTYRLPRL